MIRESLAVVMLFLLAIAAVACNRSGDSDNKAPTLSETTVHGAEQRGPRECS